LDGKVIDWIRLSPIPTFNVADSAVTVAVTLLLARSLFGHDR
jgi:lipoprotein signal peptidase